MNKAKQMLSCLLVLVMILSLVPVYPARAEGEEDTYQVGIEKATTHFSCNCQDGQYSVSPNGSCTIIIWQSVEGGQLSDLEITVNGESVSTDDLEEVDGKENEWSYTITDVTENQNIRIFEQGTELDFLISGVPTKGGYEVYDAAGSKLDISGNTVSLKAEKGGTVTFRIKGSTDVLDYGILADGEELPATKVDENTYSYTVSDIDWNTVVSFQKKYKVTSEVAVIPCTDDGTPLDGYNADGVTEFWATGMQLVYFKLPGSAAGYRLSVNDVILTHSGSVFHFIMADNDIQIMAQKQYEVTFGRTSCCYVEFTDIAESWWDEESEALKGYATGAVTFTVVVREYDYDVSGMQVTMTGKTGKVSLTKGERSVNDDNETVYSFTSAALTEDVVIDVTGIYSKESYGIRLDYDAEEFEGVSMIIRDENGTALNRVNGEEYTWIGAREGHTYELVLSSETVDLTKLKALLDREEELLFEKDGDSYVADLPIRQDCVLTLALGDQYYVDCECADEVSAGVLRLFGSEDKATGFQKVGELKFWIDAWHKEEYSSEHAIVRSIVDSTGQEVSFTKEENVSVDRYGTQRTVYTVDVEDDLTIYYEGMEKCKYNVYLPIPSTKDRYTISELQMDDNKGGYISLEGEPDSGNTYKTYRNVEYGTGVQFDVTVPSAEVSPLVSQKGTYEDGEGYIWRLEADFVVTNDDGTVTYTYPIYLQDTIEILITTDTQEMEVVTKGGEGYVEWDDLWHVWNIYDKEDEEQRTLLASFNLPKIVDKAATDQTYDFSLEFPWGDDEETGDSYQLYRLKKNSGNNVFTASDSKNTPYTSLSYDEDNVDLGEYTMPAGCYKLEVDISPIIPYVSYLSLSTEREDLSIAPVTKDGASYTTEISGGKTYYIPESDVFYFQVTADKKTAFDDMAIDWWELKHEEEVSADGLTRTYKLTDISYDADIRAAYTANLQMKNGQKVSVGTNAFYGDAYDYEENKSGRTVRNLASGRIFELSIGVAEGYDPDSVKIKHEHNGIVDTYSVDKDSGHSDRDRWLDVKLYPGDNVFYATEPESNDTTSKTYNVDVAASTAYTVELVNGSNKTVKHGGSFSFRIKANTGYDLSGIAVTADGQRMTPDANGIYTITDIKKDYEIAVSGYKTSSFIVTFKDYNGNVIGKPQTVDFGKNAKAPTDPVRKGYRFTGWDTGFTNVRQNLVVTATYKPILVDKITIGGGTAKLAVGKSIVLKADVAPADALNTAVLWSSSNNKYATVTAAGKVTAKKAGAGKTVTITAAAQDGSGKKATFKIKIYKNAVKKIKLSAKSKSVKPGKKVTIKATVSPSKGINKTLKWSSSNEKYATVNSKGVVTAKKAGKGKTVTITARATDGSNKKATIKIKIKKK
ncbi:MAG: Ig-like domain-containing protein [Clostridium sp.]|nr:Ig-like domain-containing protein [Clostridium sp.]